MEVQGPLLARVPRRDESAPRKRKQTARVTIPIEQCGWNSLCRGHDAGQHLSGAHHLREHVEIVSWQTAQQHRLFSHHIEGSKKVLSTVGRDVEAEDGAGGPSSCTSTIAERIFAYLRADYEDKFRAQVKQTEGKSKKLKKLLDEHEKSKKKHEVTGEDMLRLVLCEMPMPHAAASASTAPVQTAIKASSKARKSKTTAPHPEIPVDFLDHLPSGLPFTMRQLIEENHEFVMGRGMDVFRTLAAVVCLNIKQRRTLQQMVDCAIKDEAEADAKDALAAGY
eukprot:GSA25T00021175001.1